MKNSNSVSKVITFLLISSQVFSSQVIFASEKNKATQNESEIQIEESLFSNIKNSAPEAQILCVDDELLNNDEILEREYSF